MIKRHKSIAFNLLSMIILTVSISGCFHNTGIPSTPPVTSPDSTVIPTMVPSDNTPGTSVTASTSVTTPATLIPSSTPAPTYVHPDISQAPYIVIDRPVPDTYITYQDPNGLFSISYPDDWQLPPDKIQEMKNASDSINKYLGSELEPFPNNIGSPWVVRINTNNYLGAYLWCLPFDESSILHYNPDILPTNQIPIIYKTIIGGYEAIIVEDIGYASDAGAFGNLTLTIYTEKITWSLTCYCRPKDYQKWQDDFRSIAGSLRILKEDK